MVCASLHLADPSGELPRGHGAAADGKRLRLATGPGRQRRGPGRQPRQGAPPGGLPADDDAGAGPPHDWRAGSPAEPPAQIDTDTGGAAAAAGRCKAGDSVQCVPPSADQAATREVRPPEPAARIAVVRPPVVARPARRTASRPERPEGPARSAARQPAEYAKSARRCPPCRTRRQRPTSGCAGRRPGHRGQCGEPADAPWRPVRASAIRLRRQLGPGRAEARALVRWCRDRSARAAGRRGWPPGRTGTSAEARAQQRWSATTGAPASVVVASGENVRS